MDFYLQQNDNKSIRECKHKRKEKVPLLKLSKHSSNIKHYHFPLSKVIKSEFCPAKYTKLPQDSGMTNYISGIHNKRSACHDVMFV